MDTLAITGDVPVHPIDNGHISNGVGRSVVASESVVGADMDDEAVLLNAETGIYFGLDAVGTEIWKSVEAGAREDEIVERLRAAFDVDEAQLRSDVAEFLDLLIAKGLAQVVDA
jgi:hypothetical protein